MRSHLRTTLLICCASALTACDPQSDARARWLTNELVTEAWPQLQREPSEVAGKWAVMVDSPYSWLRGTAQLYARDETEQNDGHLPTARVNADMPLIWLTGDPHLENISAELGPDHKFRLEFDDMDTAGWGPYSFDVRRTALGAWIVAEGVALDDPVRDGWAQAAVLGYVDEIKRLSQGLPGTPMDVDADLGVVFNDLMARAKQAAEEGHNWTSFAEPGPGGHRLLRGELSAPGDGFVNLVLDEPTPTLRLVVEDAVTQKLGMRVLDIARRRGQGVGSYAHWRFYIVADLGSDGPEDDYLLEWKECPDAISFHGLDTTIVPPAEINGERVVLSARNLQSRPDLDRWLGWSGDQALSGKMRSRADPIGDTEAGFSSSRLAGKLAKKKWTVADVTAFAEQCGRLLAQTHARAPLRTGLGHALDVLAPELVAHGAALVTEAVASAHASGLQLRRDLALIQQLRAERGPLLGWEPQLAVRQMGAQ